MEPPTPFSTKSFSKEIKGNKININLSSSEDILSLSTEINNKKYRLTVSINELKNSQIFFKQFSSPEQIITALSKIITSSNNIEIKDKEIIIKFNNFLEEEISLKIPEEICNVELLYINLKKLQIENENLQNIITNNVINNNENPKKGINKNSESRIKNSEILKDDEDIMIKNWINNNKPLSFDLIYKATRDGDDVKDFHKLCDEISPSLTIVRAKNGNRFGGYTSVALTKNASDQAINDPNAFVFSIDKKYKYNTNNPSYAIRSMASRGPCFGDGCPFYIGNKFLTNNSSYSNPSNDYNCPPYVLTGAQYFTVDELEVYKVNFI